MMMRVTTSSTGIVVSFVLFLVLSLSFVTDTAATATESNSNTSSDDGGDGDDNNSVIRCVTEWGLTTFTDDGDGDDTKKLMKVIPSSQINDGYCDCIYSGLDETTTSACSGFIMITSSSSSTTTTSSTTKDTPIKRFTCPQQPNIQLHTSRIHDGICDCCDGADEISTTSSTSSTTTSSTSTSSSNHCTDQCATVLAAYRAEMKQRQVQYNKGRTIRNQMMTSYSTMIQSTKKKIKQLQHDIQTRTQLLHTKYIRSLTSHQIKYTNIHVQRIYNIIYAKFTGLVQQPNDDTKTTTTTTTTKDTLPFALLHDLTISDLERFIVVTCQMAGEVVMGASSDTTTTVQQQQQQKTCVPLRLATIEIGDLFTTTVLSKQTNNNNNNKTTVVEETITDDVQQQQHDTQKTTILRRLSKDDEYHNDDILSVILANIYDYNSIYYPEHPIFMHEDYIKYQEQFLRGNSGSKTTTTTTTATKKKVKKHDDDDDDEDDYDNEEEEEYEDEDEYDRDTENHVTTNTKKIFIPTTVYDDSITIEERTLYQTMLSTTSLSKSRQSTIQRIQTLLTYIDNQITILEQEEAVGDDHKTDELVLADEAVAVPIDHTDEIEHLRNIRKQLQTTITQIDSGITYGISALKLLSSITPETMTFHFVPQFIFGDPNNNMKASTNDIELFHQQYLQKLFLLTLYYSQLSIQQLYEIFILSLTPSNEAVDDDNNNNDNDDDQQQQCTLPYAHLCPPKSILKESIPVPKFLFDAMETFCSTLFMDSTSTAASLDASVTTCAATDTVPDAIQDGYLGYYPVRARDTSDILTQLLHPLSYDPTYCTDDEIHIKREMRLIQETVTQYYTNLHSMEKTLHELKESIENVDTIEDNFDDNEDDENENKEDRNNITVLPKYGLDGELHSIQDQCFDFTQGKYKYEICLFQGATQKDIDSTHGAGTSLGHWKGTFLERKMENNIVYNERIWKWEKGAQCWNGPQRSITAHINQCGPITRITSATEPDTCRYVVEVESPIACDETYQRRYGLE